MKTKLNSNKKKSIKIKIFFFIIFVFGIILSIYKLNTTYDYIPPNNHQYVIIANQLNALRDFNLYHYFSENKGSISFKINQEDYSNGAYLQIDLPALIKTLKIYRNNTNGNVLYVNYTINTYFSEINQNNDTVIFLNNLPKPSGKFDSYTFNYTMTIQPSGQFIIQTPMNLRDNRPMITFNLGGDYECTKNCVELIQNTGYGYPNTYKEIRILLNQTTDSSGFYHSFTLIASRDIRVEQGLAIGVLSSSLVSILLIVKEIWETCKLK